MYFEHRTKNAACSIEVDGSTLRTRFGRREHDSKLRTETFETVHEAEQAARKAAKRLRARGYRPGHEHADLLQAIRADPADLARYAAYAEWLDSVRAPRGRLIRIELSLLEHPDDPSLRSERDELLKVPTEGLTERSWVSRFQLTWRLGFISKAVFTPPPVWPSTVRTEAAHLKDFLQHPSAALLEELTIVAPYTEAAAVSQYQQTAAKYRPPSLNEVHAQVQSRAAQPWNEAKELPGGEEPPASGPMAALRRMLGRLFY